MLLHFADDPTFVRQVAMIALMLAPVLAFIATRRTRVAEPDEFKILRHGKTLYKGWEAVMIWTGLCTLSVIIVNLVANLLRGTIKFALQPIEIYLFYGAIAIAEECTFRIAIVGGIDGKLYSMGIRSWVSIVPASIVSALVFSGAHCIDLEKLVFEFTIAPGVYLSTPSMLWATGIAGFVMATFYGATNNPLVPITAHLANNLIAASFVFTSSIVTVGGF